MQRDLMHTVVYHLYDDWQPTLGADQVSPAVARHLQRALTAWTVLSCDVADPSLTSLKRQSDYVKSVGWESLVAQLKLLKSAWQTLEVPVRDFIGLRQPYAELIRPIRASVISAMRGDARSFINVNTWLAFVVKVHVPNPRLEDEALYKWFQAEAGLGESPDWAVDYLNFLFRQTVPFAIENFFPKHGSGQVAERFLARDPVPKDEILADTISDEILSWAGLSPFSYGDNEGHTLQRCNALTFVPKSATALRAISMEPCLLQYLQQGLKDILYRDFDRNPVFRDSIHLFDRTFNQRLALAGSRSGNWATIDLSSASDTVSKDLVLRAAVGTTWFRPLAGTRSTHTLTPKGECVRLKKFAPMGSAVAFPIECMVFLAIARYAAQKDTSARWERQHVLVYGDDIIVHTSCADRLIDLLGQAGFTVNRDKSFTTGPFRESCGIEAYRGVDISPMYHRVSYLDGTRRLIPSLIDHANESFRFGYFRLREYYIAEVKVVAGRREKNLHFGVYSPDTSKIWSRTGESSPDGYHTDYQCSTRRDLVVTTKRKTVDSPRGESPALQNQLRELTRAEAPWPGGPLLEEGHQHVVSTTSAIAVRRVLFEH